MLGAFLLVATLPNLVPARWFSAEPKSLDLLRDSPVNCLLLEQPQWSPAFLEAAAKRNLAAFAVIHPSAESMDQARKAVELRFPGAVLEGRFDRAVADRLDAYLKDSRVNVVRLGLRSDIRFDSGDSIIGTFQGVWPGIQEGQDEAKSAPSGTPWIDTNTGFLRFVRASTTAPVWIANRPPAGKSFAAERYIQAIGEAAMTGAHWVVALDSDLQKRLLSGDQRALGDWKHINQALAFYQQHDDWSTAHAFGKLALIEDEPTGALLSGGVLDMIAVKHTPVRPIPNPRLSGDAMAGSSMAVNVDPESLTDQQREALKAFTRSGGTLLTGPPGWKFPAPQPGQITLEKADLQKLDEIWKELNSMTGRRNLGVRLFNVASMLSNLVETKDGQVVLHLVNYSDYPVENVTVHVLGQYKTATLYQPAAQPMKIAGYEAEDGTGFDIDRIGPLGALVLSK
jgi:hypothetical protein